MDSRAGFGPSAPLPQPRHTRRRDPGFLLGLGSADPPPSPNLIRGPNPRKSSLFRGWNLGGNKAGCHRKRSTPSPTHAGRVFVETVTTTGRPGEWRDEGVRASRERSNERIRYASRHSGQGGVLKETINQRRWKDLSSTVRQSVTRGSRQRRKMENTEGREELQRAEGALGGRGVVSRSGAATTGAAPPTHRASGGELGAGRRAAEDGSGRSRPESSASVVTSESGHRAGDRNQRGHGWGDRGRNMWRWGAIRTIREKEPLRVK